MEIVFHGAAKEVGKSCIEIISNDNKRYLMDCGVKFTHHGVEYPKFLDKLFNVSAVFLSHAHMDHSGALPMIEHKKLNCPIYTTKMTWNITNKLLADGYNLERLRNLHMAYDLRDVKKVEKNVSFVKFDKEYITKDKKVKFSYINSGHIPGGASILANISGKTILYTADLNTKETQLMVPSDISKYRGIDILITETTYGDRFHPILKDTQKTFLQAIEKGIKKGGSVLIPVFGVGRAQEVLILLSKLKGNTPIYLDGMAKKVCEIVINEGDKYTHNLDILKEMYDKSKKVNPRKRDYLAKQSGNIILTTSGMMQGGPVMSYAPHIVKDKKNTIILTGYQVNGCKGRAVWEDRIFYHKGQRIKVVADVKKFDFSAHLGRDDLKEMISKIQPKNLILQHGDVDAISSMEVWAKENLKNTKVIAPYIGEIMKF
jgi:putative mRNA 3-end processing factor